ncbi:MAG: hypothetical protein NVS3B20_02620 [Polyangiales bacterium]
MESRSETIARWLRPLVFGTLLGAWACATESAYLVRFGNFLPWAGTIKWFLFMAIATLFAAMQAIAFGAVDVVLLSLKLRVLPTGKAAWFAALIAPHVIGIIVRVRPPWHAGTLGIYLAAMLIVALALRLAVGRRPA